ncbi:hypothetical protein AAC387_Pa10g2130 [Persea americana]
MARTSTKRTLSVYLYIPNIIGYIRVLMNCVAFACCFSDKKLFAVLYFVSFVCDGLDGWFARKFNQAKVQDFKENCNIKVSTACLLVILSHFYRPAVVFLSLLSLDIASHWLQMYSTILAGKASHKDVKDSTNWLLKAYYGNQLFMCYCCVASEVLYIILFLLAGNEPESVISVLVNAVRRGSLLSFPAVLSLFGWAIKQAVNVIQNYQMERLFELQIFNYASEMYRGKSLAWPCGSDELNSIGNRNTTQSASRGIFSLERKCNHYTNRGLAALLMPMSCSLTPRQHSIPLTVTVQSPPCPDMGVSRDAIACLLL